MGTCVLDAASSGHPSHWMSSWLSVVRANFADGSDHRPGISQLLELLPKTTTITIATYQSFLADQVRLSFKDQDKLPQHRATKGEESWSSHETRTGRHGKHTLPESFVLRVTSTTATPPLNKMDVATHQAWRLQCKMSMASWTFLQLLEGGRGPHLNSRSNGSILSTRCFSGRVQHPPWQGRQPFRTTKGCCKLPVISGLKFTTCRGVL